MCYNYTTKEVKNESKLETSSEGEKAQKVKNNLF